MMKVIKVVIHLAVVWFTFLTTSGFATVYYVAPDGEDSNPGTVALPWQTIGKAASTLIAGDIVYVRAGTYAEQVIPRYSGISGAEIHYSAYSNETVTIDGAGLNLPEWSGLFDLTGREYLRVSGFRVINSGPTLHNPGIQADTSRHIIIEKNNVYSTTDSGILVWNSSDIIIDGNAIEAACTNMYNECITVGVTDYFEIRNNYVHHSQKEGICAKDGSSYGRIYGNIVHDTAATGFYVDAQAVHTHDIEVFDNVSYNGVEDGFTIASEVGGLLENITLTNNVAFNNGWAGFDISDCCIEDHPLKTIRLINNTSFNNGIDWGGGILVQNPQAIDVIIRNNIVSQNLTFQIAVSSQMPPGSVIVDHNLIDGFRGGEDEVYGTGYVEGDPLFVDAASGDFHIQADSPAIDRGSSDSAPITDFDAESRPHGAGFDIGPDEYWPHAASYAVILMMPSHFFRFGDVCSLDVSLFNPGESQTGTPFICILDVLHEYWFWPEWGQDFEYTSVDLTPGQQSLSIIPSFIWPDTGSDTLDGITFWAAMTNDVFTEILGGDNGLGTWTFGFGI